jgi:hypothetical protein
MEITEETNKNSDYKDKKSRGGNYITVETGV